MNPTENNIKFETGIGPMTDKILNSIIDKLSADNLKEKLTDKVVYPLTEIVNEKIRPYIYISLILYLVIIILLIAIIYLLARRKK